MIRAHQPGSQPLDIPEGRYGVTFEYDDGRKETIEAATREAAELAAKDRIGNDVPITNR